MFNFFKKKQVQTDEEPGFLFSEFPEEMFKKDKKKDKEVISKNPSEGWVCGTPEYSLKVARAKDEINNKIPNKVMKEVEAELDEIFKDTHKGMGFCHQYWAKKKQLLKDRGYEWFSPKDLNPDVIYD